MVSAYTVPTDLPESDGTLEWNATTIILVELDAGDKMGLGYTYADKSVAQLINENCRKLSKVEMLCQFRVHGLKWSRAYVI